MQRFTKDGTDRAMRVSATEREAGKRASYHVYYRRNGKTMFDASYADTPQQAEKDMLGFAKELRWKGVEVVGVISLVPDVSLA
jgi:hypothetical protein